MVVVSVAVVGMYGLIVTKQRGRRIIEEYGVLIVWVLMVLNGSKN